MTTQISGDTGVSQCQPNSVSQDDLQAPVQKQIAAVACVFNGQLAGTNPPSVGFGVASITKTGVGLFTLTFSTPFADANYVALVTAYNSHTGIVCTVSGGSSASQLNLAIYSLAGVLTDPGQVNVVLFKV